MSLLWLLLCLPISALAQEPPRMLENSIGMKMVMIRAGQFLMGNPESVEALHLSYSQLEKQRIDELTDELPVHTVRITRDFYMGQTEVTVGQFAQFVAQSGYVPESIADGTGGYGYSVEHDQNRPEKADAFSGRDPQFSWRQPGFSQNPEHPVLNVSWKDAVAMADWLSKKEGQVYRLPTEAEWEYACKAGEQRRYAHGDNPLALPQWANTFDQSATPHWQRWKNMAVPGNDGYAFTSPVASYPPNAFGLHDMVGNVWEWVSDHYDENYYKVSPTDNPSGPAQGQLRVRRGGSWHTWSIYARCSYRNLNAPDSRYPLLGMRLVREIAK